MSSYEYVFYGFAIFLLIWAAACAVSDRKKHEPRSLNNKGRHANGRRRR